MSFILSSYYYMNFRPKGKKPMAHQTYINEAIKAPNIMIVDEEGNNLGVFPRTKALMMKDEAGLDLVQLSYDRDKMVSTVKMVDYGKYMYDKSKEEKAKRKKQKVKEMKETKIKYSIAENDLRMKMDKSIEFLQDGHSVKFTIRLRGRERIYGNKAKEKLMFIAEELAAYGKMRDAKPKEESSWYSIILFSK